ncbi:3-ketoacyl-CoA synthase 10-like [Chenopodium quinoa]|uniref:3-ketoacyl-CoA synthase n=1 Tax=Chenopodium quinoa TaxID=63459 RepID=A0A803MER9_CHEQI|nr:3-ketoacyl-CoA synthase 10-like [Chenopodium quinoa]
MSTKMENFSTDIVNTGVENEGPYAGSLNFSVRVRRGLPNFLNSMNLKYVKLGYQYLISHGLYIVAAPLLALIVGAHLGKLIWDDYDLDYDFSSAILLLGLIYLVDFTYNFLLPRPTYLIDFACYSPPKELKVSKKEFIDLARKSGNFDEKTLVFQEKALKYSGIGDETCMPKAIFQPGFKRSLKQSREEAAMVIFGAIDDLLAATKINPKDITILIVNCTTLNTTPSLSAMVINHYKLKHNVQSFNLGGMGCAAGAVAIDMAQDLLNVYPGSYALVVSTEIISHSWYTGKELDMVIPNCFLRMGGAAMLLSNRRLDRWRAKYELKQVVRTNKGMDNRSFKSIYLKEDAEGQLGISVSKDVLEVGGNAVKANITTLGPLVLPFTEQFQFFTTLLRNKTSSRPYIPNFKQAFNHFCIIATSKKVIDEFEKNLELTTEYMEPSRRTLERFGNTSSSSVWYELAYLEANKKMKRGDRVWQISFGSGIKCNSLVWRALRNIEKPNKSPWFDQEDSI